MKKIFSRKGSSITYVILLIVIVTVVVCWDVLRTLFIAGNVDTEDDSRSRCDSIQAG
ncbi:hypothetical protein D3C76_1697320 [compost metagenome]